MPTNLEGQRFGKLTVLSLIERRKKGRSIWLTACDCGRTEEMSQLKIPYCTSNAERNGARYSCTVCHRGACVICGSEILTDVYRGVCSPQCHHERKKRSDRQFYYNKIERDPDLNKRNYRRKRANPSLVEKMREYDRNRALARRKRPDYLETERLRYQKNKDAIIARRNEIRQNLTEEQLEARREQQRLRDRERARQEALSNLFTLGNTLNERHNETD